MDWKSFGSDMLAGGASGIVAKTVTAPVERIKLILQTQHVNGQIAIRYLGPIDCMVRIYREQGIISFWRGNMASVYRYFPNQAITFATKDKLKSLFLGQFTKEDNVDYSKVVVGNLMAGGIAGGLATFVCYPLDFARTRLATDIGGERLATQRKYRGILHCIYKTYRTEGFKAIYAGFGLSIVGVFLFRALFIGGYDIVKYSFDIERGNLLVRFLAAQAVTTVAGFACYPFDTLKRILMVKSLRDPILGSAGAQKEVKYTTARQAFKDVLREEGFRGLYKGMSVNFIRGLGGPVLLVGYDEFKKLLAKLDE